MTSERIQAVLQEYQALRSEMFSQLTSHHKLLGWALLPLGGVIAVGFSQPAWAEVSFALFLPIGSSILFSTISLSIFSAHNIANYLLWLEVKLSVMLDPETELPDQLRSSALAFLREDAMKTIRPQGDALQVQAGQVRSMLMPLGWEHWTRSRGAYPSARGVYVLVHPLWALIPLVSASLCIWHWLGSSEATWVTKTSTALDLPWQAVLGGFIVLYLLGGLALVAFQTRMARNMLDERVNAGHSGESFTEVGKK